jgi:hypothetical protein
LFFNVLEHVHLAYDTGSLASWITAQVPVTVLLRDGDKNVLPSLFLSLQVILLPTTAAQPPQYDPNAIFPIRLLPKLKMAESI